MLRKGAVMGVISEVEEIGEKEEEEEGKGFLSRRRKKIEIGLYLLWSDNYDQHLRTGC